ncbi:MAG: class I mannose-6-phosphate isomerase [Elusimicrobiota bacterium]|nr:class I mannose-6-phosphate isomerase [Elusimicrobiota bacterium]
MNDILTFKPIYKTKIWGGNKLKNNFGKTDAPQATGESWEVSAVAGNASQIANGAFAGEFFDALVKKYPMEIMGKRLYKKYGIFFPLLVKLIDASDNLSVQVHPDDNAAKKVEGTNAFGKTEMWYVLQADKGSSLISGFKRNVNREKYLKSVANNDILDILAVYKVKAGDAFYIPAGRVHAIGRGILVVEVQQTSDTTYRIFDYNRKGSDDKLRELHTEKAKQALNFDGDDGAPLNLKDLGNGTRLVVQSPYFIINTLDIKQNIKTDYTHIDSFIILTGIAGKIFVNLDYEPQAELTAGKTVLIPHIVKNKITLSGQGKLLEIYIP